MNPYFFMAETDKDYFDDFAKGRLVESEMPRDRQIIDPRGFYDIAGRLRKEAFSLVPDRAVMGSYLLETGLYCFCKTPSGVLVLAQSLRNMYLSSAWGIFNDDIDDSVERVSPKRSSFNVNVPHGWSFAQLRDMVQAFNFDKTGRLDPELRMNRDALCLLAENGWHEGVNPLAGAPSKY